VNHVPLWGHDDAPVKLEQDPATGHPGRSRWFEDLAFKPIKAVPTGRAGDASMQKTVSATQQQSVTFQGGNPRPAFFAERGEVLAAADMHQTKASVLVVNDDVVTVQPSEQSPNGGASGTGAPTTLFCEQMKIAFSP
jgi:hypothetical protein